MFRSLFFQTSGKKKAHIYISFFFVRLVLGRPPGLSRGFHQVCPWNKPGENLGQKLSVRDVLETLFQTFCQKFRKGQARKKSTKIKFLGPAISPTPEKGASSQKIPFFTVLLRIDMGILWLEAPFSGVGEMAAL